MKILKFYFKSWCYFHSINGKDWLCQFSCMLQSVNSLLMYTLHRLISKQSVDTALFQRSQELSASNDPDTLLRNITCSDDATMM